MALYRPRLRSSGLLCGMRAAPPRSAFVSLALRLGFISALCKNGAPKLRRLVQGEVAALRAMAWRLSDVASTSPGCHGRAPRIEAARCDELSDSDELLLLQLMRHNYQLGRRSAAMNRGKYAK
jgi:hypothetical protein